MAELFHWNEGLSLSFRQAKGFYLIILLSTLGGLIVNFLGVAPFRMLYYTAIFNGIASPLLLVMILFIANDKAIMGKFVNSLWSNILGITITVQMG
jgi:Mn2+/Fe2+ NRAMP family transporter